MEGLGGWLNKARPLGIGWHSAGKLEPLTIELNPPTTQSLCLARSFCVGELNARGRELNENLTEHIVAAALAPNTWTHRKGKNLVPRTAAQLCYATDGADRCALPDDRQFDFEELGALAAKPQEAFRRP